MSCTIQSVSSCSARFCPPRAAAAATASRPASLRPQNWRAALLDSVHHCVLKAKVVRFASHIDFTRVRRRLVKNVIATIGYAERHDGQAGQQEVRFWTKMLPPSR